MKNKILAVLILFYPFIIKSQSVINTVHNLSVSGTGEIRSINETEVCIFCHTSHNSETKGPLWNRKLPGLSYKLYNSSTMKAVPGQPDGSSILCLSCHDGTIALGSVLSKKEEIEFNTSNPKLSGRSSDLTTDLSDDHIISFDYNSVLSYQNDKVKNPNELVHPVKLEKGKLQCSSCHDPHKNMYGNFLVVPIEYSSLCLSCHEDEGWETSSHRNSTASWKGTGKNPWFHTEQKTVAENGCQNCHNTHSANGNERLLKYKNEESNCLDCHNGNVAAKNIEMQINKSYSHNVTEYYNEHDAAEESIVQKKHVECQDCHNPHSSRKKTAYAPNVKGFNEGVSGVSQNGNEISQSVFEYEICYKCHSESLNKPTSVIPRQIEQNNVRLEFDPTNPSFHPVAGVGKNTKVPSLIDPLNESSLIYCTTCHSSNGNDSPAGPHGSIYPHILKYNYSTEPETFESYHSYELCYTCHNRNVIISDQPNEFQKNVHNLHIVKNNVSCSVCHDPHGVSSLQGSDINNSNLINFDMRAVAPLNGVVKFEDEGFFSGNCTLSCHGKDHNSASYK